MFKQRISGLSFHEQLFSNSSSLSGTVFNQSECQNENITENPEGKLSLLQTIRKIAKQRLDP